MHKLSNRIFNIVSKFKVCLIISLSVLLIGIIFMCIPELRMNVGIDFIGGTVMEIEMPENDNVKSYIDNNYSKLKELIEKKASKIEIKGVPQHSTVDGSIVFEIRFSNEFDGEKVTESNQDEFMAYIDGDKNDDKVNGVCGDIKDQLLLDLDIANEDDISVKSYSVGATASSTLLRNAFLALIVAVALMLVYICIRFTVSSALAAIVALLHDVLIMTALTVIFQIPVNSTFVAAIITIVGYSINASIVIFDRIREESKFETAKTMTDAELANSAVTHTLMRSILTSATTLVTVLVLAILGVSTIREFVIPIIFGLFAGTFSSVFLAPSFWVLFRKLGKKIKDKRATSKGLKRATKNR